MDFKYPFLIGKLKETNDFDVLDKATKNRTFPIAVTGVSHIQRIVLASALAVENGIKPLIITAGEAENERVCEDLEALGWHNISRMHYLCNSQYLYCVQPHRRHHQHLYMFLMLRYCRGLYNSIFASV